MSSSSQEATPPINDGLSSSAPSPSLYPPGFDKVRIDWSEHYDRQESQSTGDEIGDPYGHPTHKVASLQVFGPMTKQAYLWNGLDK